MEEITKRALIVRVSFTSFLCAAVRSGTWQGRPLANFSATSIVLVLPLVDEHPRFLDGFAANAPIV